MSKISRKIAKQTHIRESDVRIVLNGMNEYLVNELKQHGTVSIPCLGNVELVEKKPHRFRDVVTGELRDSRPRKNLHITFYDSFCDKFEN